MALTKPFSFQQGPSAGVQYPTGMTYSGTTITSYLQDQTSQDGRPVKWTNDGTYLYMVGNNRYDAFRYDSSFSYTGNSFDLGVTPPAGGGALIGLSYNTNNGEYYFCEKDVTGGDLFSYQSPSWTAKAEIGSNLNTGKDLRDCIYVPDLGNFYFINISGGPKIEEYNISTGFTGQTLDMSGTATTGTRGLTWDGEKFWSSDLVNDEVYAWDWTTKSYAGITVDISAQSTLSVSIHYWPEQQVFIVQDFVVNRTAYVYNATFA